MDQLFIFLVLNAVFITVYHVKDVQDDISEKKLFPSDCITLYNDREKEIEMQTMIERKREIEIKTMRKHNYL